jgi:hypothetical protein
MTARSSDRDREAELCARCGFTLYNHAGNTGCIYPCWLPSGRFSVNKHLNNPFPVTTTRETPIERITDPDLTSGDVLFAMTDKINEIIDRLNAMNEVR